MTRFSRTHGFRPAVLPSRLGLAVIMATALAARAAYATPEQQCQASENRAAGKYTACLHNAEAKLATSGDTVKYDGARAKCGTKFDAAIGKAHNRPPCLSTPLYFDEFRPAIQRNVAALAGAFAGNGLVQRLLPATGQTTGYGPGSDGDVRAGGSLQYRDNGDGTITDLNTGLMWEKKSRDGSIHDIANQYTWGMVTDPYTMNGTIVTTFLATLNAGSGFAGHADWRLPNVKELVSLVDYENENPSIAAAFDTACAPTCTVLTCSCTRGAMHWSATANAGSPDTAWFVHFGESGSVYPEYKSSALAVRAVRGGVE